MALFNSKKHDPYAVPRELEAAYREATPDTTQWLTVAADQIATEAHVKATQGKSIMLPRGAVDRVREAQMPEVLKRAEHLARLKAADEAVHGPARAAALKRKHEEARTCPVCGEVAEQQPSSIRPAPGMPEAKLCNPCRSVAALLWAQNNATPERTRAIRAALFG